MSKLWDLAIDFAVKVNDSIYYDHVGSTANKPVYGNPLETVSETVKSVIAGVNGCEEAAKHHASRALESAAKTVINQSIKL